MVPYDNFLKLLQETAPEDYKPFILLLQKGGKAPLLGSAWSTDGLSYEKSIKALREGYNLGIAATPTDPLEIVDIDNPEIYEKGHVKETLTTRSGCRDGVHCFYYKDPKRPKLGNKPIPGQGEVRSEWYYVVAPGSYYLPNEEDYEKHPRLKENPQKGQYTIEKSIPPTTITKEELPKEFLKIINKEDKEGIDIELIINGVDKNRNDSGMRFVSFLNASDSDIKKEMELWNTKNKPPMGTTEFNRLLTKDYKYSFKQNPNQHIIENGKLKRIAQNQKYLDKKKYGETKLDGKGFKPFFLAQNIMEDNRFVCFRENDRFYIFKDGYYQHGKTYCVEITQNTLGVNSTKHKI
ncbi:hypothetical protein LCGC14_2923140, partial [marine sediment metagenome]